MVVAVDIGNSSITLGLFDGYELLSKRMVNTSSVLTEKEWINNIMGLVQSSGDRSIQGCIISSVVPDLTEPISSVLSNLTGVMALVLGRDIAPGLSFDVLKPEEVGHDRIANVVGAARIYGDPAIVVDFGTATTVSIIRDKTFIGGTIMPGLEMMARALNAYTSRLPYISIIDLIETKRDIKAIGKDTSQNIISGIIYGSAGAIERIIQEIEASQSCRFVIVLTGGHSVIIAKYLKRDFFLDPDLTLKGLRFIYEERECMN